MKDTAGENFEHGCGHEKCEVIQFLSYQFLVDGGTEVSTRAVK